MPDAPIISAGAIWRLLCGGLAASFRWVANLCDRIATRLTPPLQHRFSDAPAEWQRDVAARHPELLSDEDNWQRMDVNSGLFPNPVSTLKPNYYNTLHGKDKQQGDTTQPKSFAKEPLFDEAPLSTHNTATAPNSTPGNLPAAKAFRIKPSFSFPKERNTQAKSVSFPEHTLERPVSAEPASEKENGQHPTASVRAEKTETVQPASDKHIPTATHNKPTQIKARQAKQEIYALSETVNDTAEPEQLQQTIIRSETHVAATPAGKPKAKTRTAPAVLPEHSLSESCQLKRVPAEQLPLQHSTSTTEPHQNLWPELPAKQMDLKPQKAGRGLKDDFSDRGTLEAGRGAWNA